MKGHPVAKLRTDIFLGIIDLLSGTENNKEWKAKDTIFSFEKSSCEESARKEFPATGDYSSFPQFAIASVTTEDWNNCTDGVCQDKNAATDSATCFVVDQRTDYIVWEKDAFRNCLLSNSDFIAR